MKKMATPENTDHPLYEKFIADISTIDSELDTEECFKKIFNGLKMSSRQIKSGFKVEKLTEIKVNRRDDGKVIVSLYSPQIIDPSKRHGAKLAFKIDTFSKINPDNGAITQKKTLVFLNLLSYEDGEEKAEKTRDQNLKTHDRFIRDKINGVLGDEL